MAQGAADFPKRPIRLLVTVAPGGFNDITARAVAQKLTQAFGQQVIVDNRSGASGAIAYDILTKAPADGYTLLMASASHAISTATQPGWHVDVGREVQPISQSSSLGYVAYTHPSVPVTSFKELVAYGRKFPNKLNYGTPGVASSQHLGWELVQHITGAKFTHVPYKGGALAIQATLSGEMQFGFITVISLRPHLTAGRLRPHAVTSRTRIPAMPELPTMAESGAPGFELDQWYGLVTTAKTPLAIVNKLSVAAAEAVKSPDVAQRLSTEGATPVGSNPEEFGGVIRAEIAKWRKTIKDTGIVVN